jgi:hypothetical protein
MDSRRSNVAVFWLRPPVVVLNHVGVGGNFHVTSAKIWALFGFVLAGKHRVVPQTLSSRVVRYDKVRYLILSTKVLKRRACVLRRDSPAIQ